MILFVASADYSGVCGGEGVVSQHPPAGKQYPSILSQTFEGSFSALSKPICASKYSFESSRRDLHTFAQISDLKNSSKKCPKKIAESLSILA